MKYYVEVIVFCADGNESEWFSVNAANANEAAEKVKSWIDTAGYDYTADDCSIGEIAEQSPVIELTNIEKYYVVVKVNTTDGVEYDIYSIDAENSTDAEQIVNDWLSNNTDYDDYYKIDGVYTELPILGID